MREVNSLGVDLGGTKIEAAVLRRFTPDESRFEVITRKRVPTPAAQGYDAVLDATLMLIRDVARDAGYEARGLSIGLGMPGAISRRTGMVKNSNTVCLNNRPFREDLSRALGAPIYLENDANCFALAEARLGAGKPYRDGVIFGGILGTGVGGGVVIDGRVWPGPQQLGGEWGHHAVGPWRRRTRVSEASHGRDFGLALSEREPCFCGNMGCLELYLSGRAAERDYERRGGTSLKLKDIAERRSEDPIAALVIDEMLEAFGRGVANLIDILDPSAIVLGGGVSNLDFLYTEGRQRVETYVLNDELLTPILRHALGDSAGVLGAALLAA